MECTPLGSIRPRVRRIVGAGKPHHLADAVGALDLTPTLTADEVASLEEPSAIPQQTWF
jgi:aryl-alcohol dehydrogenase-like predicted oxidoreductase